MAVNEETGWKQLVARNGGPVIFGFKIARIIGCLTLFFLSLEMLQRSANSERDVFRLQVAIYLTFVSHCNKSFFIY